MASNDVIVRLIADVSSLQEGMNKATKELEGFKNKTEKGTSSLSSTFKKVGTVIAGAFAVDKLKDFTIGMLEATASVNALDSMFEQTFKGEQAKALELISKQAQEQGIQVDRLKGTWSSFYGTFRGNGADAVESLSLTERYMKLAGDGAAYYDMSLEEVVSRLKSLTMGNFEAGDAIGLNINATKMNALATEKLGKKWQDLNDTEKEFLLIDTAEKIYENSGAMGQGARESDSWANVLENLKSVWERLLAVVGQPALQLAVGVIQNLTSKLEGATNWVKEFKGWFDATNEATGSFAESLAVAFDMMGMEWAGNFVMGLKNMCDGMKEVVNWFKEHETITLILASSLAILTAGIIAFNVWLKAGAISLKIVSGATAIWNGICAIGTGITTAFGVAMAFLTSPIGLITMAIIGLVAIGIVLWKNWDSLTSWAKNCWGSIKDSISQSWDSVTSKVSEAWNKTKETASEMVQKTKDKFAEMVQNYKEGCIDKLNKMGFDGEYLFSTFEEGWGKIKTTLSSGMGEIKSTVSEAWGKVKETFGGFFTDATAIVEDGWNRIKFSVSVAFETIKSAVLEGWENIKTAFNEYIQPLVDIVSNTWNVIKVTIGQALEGVKTVISDAWTHIKDIIFTAFGEGVKALLEGDWEGFKQIIATALENIKLTIFEAWERVKEIFSQAWESIKATVLMSWEAIKENCGTALLLIKDAIVEAWTKIKEAIYHSFEAIKMTVSESWEKIKESFFNALESVKTTVSDAWNRVKTISKETFESLKATVSETWTKIKESISTSLENTKAKISEIWNNVKTICSTIWNGVLGDIRGKVTEIYSNIVGKFTDAKNTAVSIFESIRSGIVSKIESAKNTVKSAIDSIKSFFNFSWSLPKLKLPHVSISGKFSLSPPSVPSFGVDWYATGGIFTGASVIGVGEAGDEAVVPLSNKSKMKPFASAVASMMPDNVAKEVVTSEGAGVSINVGSLVVREEADVQKIAEQLFKLQERNRRKRGVVYA